MFSLTLVRKKVGDMEGEKVLMIKQREEMQATLTMLQLEAQGYRV
jgi:hypothetical protein